MIRPIVKYGIDVLQRAAQPVAAITPEIHELIDDMVATMYAAPGVGLAAPQIGVPLRIFVVDGADRPLMDAALDPAFRFDTQFTDREQQCLVAGDGSFEVRDSSGTVLATHDFAGRGGRGRVCSAPWSACVKCVIRPMPPGWRAS